MLIDISFIFLFLRLSLNLLMRGLIYLRCEISSQVASSFGNPLHFIRQYILPFCLFLPITSSTSQQDTFWLISRYNYIQNQVILVLNQSILYRQMAHRGQNSYPRPNQTYNSIRDQIERETYGTYPDRNSLEVHQPSNIYVPTNRNLQHSQSKWQSELNQKKSSYQIEVGKKNQIKNRIKQIIDLCKDDNSTINKEMTGVIDAERGVLDLLYHNGQDNLQQGSVTNIAPTQNYTPIKSQEIESFKNFSASKNPKNLQKDIRSLINKNSHIQLTQEAVHLIDQIERRALLQIQKLKEEKNQLINSLNEEIKRGNYEKKKNLQLQKELSYYRGSQAVPGSSIENELRSRVAYLQSLLQQGQPGQVNIPDFNVLWAQGQAIRQQTLRLLKLKQQKLNGKSDDPEKRELRQQINRLNQRIQYLESEQGGRPNKPSYEVINEEYSPIAPIHKRTNSYRQSANQYQSLVMEMRKITGN